MKTVHGTISKISVHRSVRRKSLMAFISITSGSNKIRAVLFPSVYARIPNRLDIGRMVTCKGRMGKTERDSWLIVQEIELKSKGDNHEK